MLNKANVKGKEFPLLNDSLDYLYGCSPYAEVSSHGRVTTRLEQKLRTPTY